MNGKKRRHRLEAFTLVEVMVASAVMLLGIVGMIRVLVSGSEMLDVSRKQTIAMQVIQGQLDNIRLRDWSVVNGYPASITVNIDDADQNSNVAAGFVFGPNLPAVCRNFQCKRTISTVRTDLKQITFSVTWQGSTGRSYTRSGSTYFGKNGLHVTYQRS